MQYGSIHYPLKTVSLLLATALSLFALLVFSLKPGVGIAGNTSSLFSVVFTLAALKIFLSTTMPPTAKRPFSPCGFVFWSYLFFAFFGALNYFATEQFLFTYYEISFERGAFYLSAGFLALSLGMWAGTKVPQSRKPHGRHRMIDEDRLFYLSLAFSVAVLMLNLYIYYLSGGIPVLVGFLKEDLFVSGGLGRLSRAIHLAVVAQILWYFFIISSKNTRKRVVALISLAVMIGFVLGYGARFYFFLPLLFFLIFLSRRMKVMTNILTASGVGVVVLIVSAAVINLRGGEAVSLANLFELVFSRVGVRGRDFYVLADYFRDLEGFLKGFSLLPLVTNFLPAPVWGLFGIVKSAITASGGMFLSDYFLVPFYVNTGIIGEFYLNGGLMLMLPGLFIYGYIVCRLYLRWMGAPVTSLVSLLYGYVLANIAIALSAGHFYGLSFWTYQYGFLLLVLGLLSVSRQAPAGEDSPAP